MERQNGDIVEGRDLMLYLNTGASGENPTYTPQAAATSHTITYSAETKERVTKDTKNGAFSEKTVTKLGVSIKSDCLVSVGDAAGWDKLLATFKSRKPIKLKYGFADEKSGISLHSRKAELIHPVSKQSLSIVAPVPSDSLWRALASTVSE